VQVAQIADSTFSSGNPGFGFNEGGTDEYGISSFSASSSGSNPTDGSSAGTLSGGGIDPDWILEDTANYGDGSDGNILSQNSSTGQIVTGSMTAGENTPDYTDPRTLGPQWQIQTPNGSSDFTGDNAGDILFRHISSGWNVQGGNAVSTVDLGIAPGAQGGDMSGTADFDVMVTQILSG
jgi:hypothetical protein